MRYLVVGGYAVALHGYPRYTKDMDIWIERTPENAARLLKALEQFGFASLGLQESDFLEPDQIIQLGYPPRCIDLLTSLPGVEFQECYLGRVEVEIEGVLSLSSAWNISNRTSALPDVTRIWPTWKTWNKGGRSGHPSLNDARILLQQSHSKR